MPFDFLKKKKPDDQKIPESTEASGKSLKQNLKAEGFADAESALKPDAAQNEAKSSRSMPSLRHALGIGKKEADPALQRRVTAAIGPVDQMASYALNIARRCGSFNEEYVKQDGGDPKLASRVARLGSLGGKLQGAMDKLVAAHADFMKRGFMTPLRAAIDDVVKIGNEMKMLLVGHTGQGDSCMEGSLLYNLLGAKPVDGMQLGPADALAGKTLNGTAASPSPNMATPLPMGGGPGYGLWARALRNYAADFITYCDQFTGNVAGL